MTDRKHTPLPWSRHTENGDMGIGAGGTIDSGSPDKLIIDGCGCCGSPFGVDDIAEREANAAFIVRACNMHYELVEALEKLADAVDDWNVSVESVIGRQPQTGMATANARAILARAKSGQEDDR